MTPTPTSARVLITGGTGFAGSHLVEHLFSIGYTDVHVTTIGAETRPSSTESKLVPTKHVVNLLERETVSQLLIDLQPTQVYHLAAMAEVGSSFAAAEKTIINNSVIQLNLLEAIREHSAKSRVLIVGSAQEYDVLSPEFKANPTPIDEHATLGPSNPYAVSKVCQDLLGLAYYYSYQLDLVRVRPFNHIGERQSPQFAVPNFAKQIAAAEIGVSDTIKVGNLGAIRDFTDVKDMVKAYQVVMDHGQAGEVYNIGSGQGFTMQEILDQLVALAKVPIKVVVDPQALRPVDIPTIIADTTKMKSLGWEPKIPMSQTLERVLEYWRQHP